MWISGIPWGAWVDCQEAEGIDGASRNLALMFETTVSKSARRAKAGLTDVLMDPFLQLIGSFQPDMVKTKSKYSLPKFLLVKTGPGVRRGPRPLKLYEPNPAPWQKHQTIRDPSVKGGRKLEAQTPGGRYGLSEFRFVLRLESGHLRYLLALKASVAIGNPLAHGLE